MAITVGENVNASSVRTRRKRRAAAAANSGSPRRCPRERALRASASEPLTHS